MRISDWSSDVCSSDLQIGVAGDAAQPQPLLDIEGMGIEIPFSLRAVIAKDPLCTIQIGIAQARPAAGELVGQIERIEGLLVLAPADIADETVIIEDQPLTAGGGLESGIGVAYVRLLALCGIEIGRAAGRARVRKDVEVEG